MWNTVTFSNVTNHKCHILRMNIGIPAHIVMSVCVVCYLIIENFYETNIIKCF